MYLDMEIWMCCVLCVRVCVCVCVCVCALVGWCVFVYIVRREIVFVFLRLEREGGVHEKMHGLPAILPGVGGTLETETHETYTQR